MKPKPFNLGDLVKCEGSDIHNIIGVLEKYEGVNFGLKVTVASDAAPNHTVGTMLEVSLHEITHFAYSGTPTTATSSIAMKILLMTGVGA